jgi:hypothetical protein
MSVHLAVDTIVIAAVVEAQVDPEGETAGPPGNNGVNVGTLAVGSGVLDGGKLRTFDKHEKFLT